MLAPVDDALVSRADAAALLGIPAGSFKKANADAVLAAGGTPVSRSRDENPVDDPQMWLFPPED